MYVFHIYKNARSTCACVSRIPVTGSSVRIFQIQYTIIIIIGARAYYYYTHII